MRGDTTGSASSLGSFATLYFLVLKFIFRFILFEIPHILLASIFLHKDNSYKEFMALKKSNMRKRILEISSYKDNLKDAPMEIITGTLVVLATLIAIPFFINTISAKIFSDSSEKRLDRLEYLAIEANNSLHCLKQQVDFYNDEGFAGNKKNANVKQIVLYFNPAKALITEKQSEKLLRELHALKGNNTYRFFIKGYASKTSMNKQNNNFHKNHELSLARAQNIKSYITKVINDQNKSIEIKYSIEAIGSQKALENPWVDNSEYRKVEVEIYNVGSEPNDCTEKLNMKHATPINQDSLYQYLLRTIKNLISMLNIYDNP